MRIDLEIDKLNSDEAVNAVIDYTVDEYGEIAINTVWIDYTDQTDRMTGENFEMLVELIKDSE